MTMFVICIIIFSCIVNFYVIKTYNVIVTHDKEIANTQITNWKSCGKTCEHVLMLGSDYA